MTERRGMGGAYRLRLVSCGLLHRPRRSDLPDDLVPKVPKLSSDAEIRKQEGLGSRSMGRAKSSKTLISGNESGVPIRSSKSRGSASIYSSLQPLDFSFQRREVLWTTLLQGPHHLCNIPLSTLDDFN